MEDTITDPIVDLVERQSTTLNIDQEQILRDLLEDNKDICGRSNEPTQLAEHRINTTTDEPVSVRSYPLSYKNRA